MPPQSPSKSSTAWLKDREPGPRLGETSHSQNYGRGESSPRSAIPPPQYSGFFPNPGQPPAPATSRPGFFSTPESGYGIPPSAVTSSSIENHYPGQHMVQHPPPYLMPAGLSAHDRPHQPSFPPHSQYHPGPAEGQYRPHLSYPSFHPVFPRQEENKRRRRRPEEIDRIYICGWEGCQKGYGTLNHLNAHVTMQSHGTKRKPEQFKEIRKAWKENKKASERQRRESENQGAAPSTR